MGVFIIGALVTLICVGVHYEAPVVASRWAARSIGPARLLSGFEAMLGLVLIAWTASFTYFEMERNWSE